MALLPEDRYRSPRELADEMEHWLAGEPVAAWPEPWSLRVRRWVARRRTLVTAACVAALVTIAALGGIAVLQVWSNQKLTAANAGLREARARAEGRVNLALRAIENFRAAVQENLDVKNRPELAPLRTELLRAPWSFTVSSARTSRQASRFNQARRHVWHRPSSGLPSSPPRSTRSPTRSEPLRRPPRFSRRLRMRIRTTPRTGSIWPGQPTGLECSMMRSDARTTPRPGCNSHSTAGKR